MGSVPEPQQFRPGRPWRPAWPWMLALLTVLIAGAAVYLLTTHWLHILAALPYLGVVLMMGMHLFMHGGHGGHRGVPGPKVLDTFSTETVLIRGTPSWSSRPSPRPCSGTSSGRAWPWPSVQTFKLLSALTAEENFRMPLIAAGIPRKDARAKARIALEQLELGHRLRSLPRDLSGGEKQRVAIARSLANDPRLILADEPTANLDAKTGQDVTLLLCETACRENRAVIIVSHDQRLRTAAKRVITIEDGRLTAEERGEHDGHCRMHTAGSPL